MADTDRLSPALHEFIESMGVYCEQSGLPRICGRIVGLLMVAERPLSLDDMAAALQVSRASASTNVRLAMTTGVAELITIPGDRRDYYRFVDNPWERHIARQVAGLAALRRMAESGLVALAPDDRVARARLQQMRDFCDFSLHELEGIITRWREMTQWRERAHAVRRPRQASNGSAPQDQPIADLIDLG